MISISSLRQKTSEFYSLLGKDLSMFIIISIAVGIFLFFVEYSFVFLMQAFLLSLGIGEMTSMKLPQWVPQNTFLIYFLFLLAGTARICLTQFKVYLGRMANQVFIRKFRNNILEYSIANATKVSSHEVFSIFSDTLSRAGSVIIEGISLIIGVVSSILLLVAGFRIAPYEMLIGVIVAGLLALELKKISRIALKSGMSLNKSWDSTTKILLEGIRHHYFLKTHGLVNDQINRGWTEIEYYEKNHKLYFLLTSIKNTIPQIIGLLLLIVLSFIGKNYFHTNGASLIAFLYLFLRISQTGSEVQGLMNNISFNYPSLLELNRWNKNHQLNLKNKKESESLEDLKIQEIELEKVSFSFGDKPLLKNIDLKINKGDVLVIDAPSGSGKSTLIGIILNILKPESGSVKINGQEIKSFAPYSKSVSYVGPDPYLLNDTVRNNLTYGLAQHQIQDFELWHYLKITHSDTFVRAMPQGLDEILHEHTQLSTGQKQRLAITRALLRKPNFLILDEATSNLDLELEKSIAFTIKNLMQDGLVILVSHKGHIKSISTKMLNLNSP